MPRYFLHVHQNSERTEDPDGQDFDSLALAIEEAKAAARDLVADQLLTLETIGLTRSIVITDVDGKVMSTVPFKDALRPEE